jgi:hypothetical protein
VLTWHPWTPPEEGRVSRWRDKLSAWTQRVRDFRSDGFYERFPAKGQIERVARIHRELLRTAGIQSRAAEAKSSLGFVHKQLPRIRR